jgi:hypothetical protein
MKQLWERFGDFMGAAHPPKSNGRAMLETVILVNFGFYLAYFAR